MYWKTSLEPNESQDTSHGASGESRVSHLKSPKGALTHHRPKAGGGSPCGARALSEGDCDLCGDRQPMSPCLQARRASAARFTHISHADSAQHGKYATGMILMPSTAFANLPPAALPGYGCLRASSYFSFSKEKQKRGSAEPERRNEYGNLP